MFYLKLYLTIGVSIASCERSFSMFKLIKYYLRSTMGKVGYRLWQFFPSKVNLSKSLILEI